jgi:hypothetical protein
MNSFNVHLQANAYQKTGNVMDRKIVVMEKMSLAVLTRLVLLMNSHVMLAVSRLVGNAMVM